MKGKRFTVSQIISILKEAEAGTKTGDLCRKYSIAQNTFYNWKAKYGGMELSDARRLKELEEENRKLKNIVAEQALDIQCLKAVNAKKF